MAKTSGKDKETKSRKSIPPASTKNLPRDTEQMEKSFESAIHAVEKSPDSIEAWNHLEELSQVLQKQNEVGGLYRKLIDFTVTKKAGKILIERAVRFHEEWFADDTDVMIELFTKILDIDPTADWAFEKILVILTASQQWNQLLNIYDKKLGATEDQAKRCGLLEDAAQIAKDFANQPERAVEYFKQILSIEPENERAISALERLLERLGQWQDLINLWQTTIPKLKPAQVVQLRLKSASLWLEKVNNPQKSLEEILRLMILEPNHPEGLSILERIMCREDASIETREKAFEILKSSYERLGREKDLLRILHRGLEFISGPHWKTLCREIADRLTKNGKYEEAIEQYAKILIAEPSNDEIRQKLAECARSSGKYERVVAILLDAEKEAQENNVRAFLLKEAGIIEHQILNNPVKAIEIYEKILKIQDLNREMLLNASHTLIDLLTETKQNEKLLEVLEFSASFEESSLTRKFVLGKAAHIATEIANTEKAIEIWKKRLEDDNNDIEALDSLIEIFENKGNRDELLHYLERRAGLKTTRRKSDLSKIAKLLMENPETRSKALETWMTIIEEFGADSEAITLIDTLAQEQGRIEELVKIFENSANQQQKYFCYIMTRTGEIQLQQYKKIDTALALFKGALAIDPYHEPARRGLRNILQEKDYAWEAGKILEEVFEKTSEWNSILEILEERLSACKDATRRVELLLKASNIKEVKMQDTSGALELVVRAFLESPVNLFVENEMKRLTEITQKWEIAASSYQKAAEKMKESPVESAYFKYAEAKILDEKIGDYIRATEAYLDVISLDPAKTNVLELIPRVAMKSRNWDIMATSAIKLFKNQRQIDLKVIEELEKEADKTGEYDKLIDAMTMEMEKESETLPRDVARDLWMRIALWQKNYRKDFISAQKLARKAVNCDPSSLQAIEILLEIEKNIPDFNIVNTLLEKERIVVNNLDPLWECGEIMLKLKGDIEKTITIFQKLYSKASRMLVNNVQSEGIHNPLESLLWATQNLSFLYMETGNSQKAASILLDCAEIHPNKTEADSFRYKAAKILTKVDRTKAIEIFSRLVEDYPDDIEKIQEAAEICKQEGKILEELSFRLKELEKTLDTENKLNLRIRIANLSGLIEDKGERLRILQENLSERPGHEQTINQIIKLLSDTGRFDLLADILEKQSKALEESGQIDGAVKIWSMVASVCHQRLRDVNRAVHAYKKVVELGCTNEALDALASISLEQNAPLEAAQWLEKRLQGTGTKEKVAVLLKLAKTLLMAEQFEKAVSYLENAFEEAPKNAEVRKLLIETLRTHEWWDKLVHVLNESSNHISDRITIKSYATQAFEISSKNLRNSSLALPVLEKATALDPEDMELKRMYAESLLSKGKTKEAGELFQELIDSFGRRRSPQRAEYHLKLGLVFRMEGSFEEALEQLDTALKMDPSNAKIIKTTAETALEAGNIEKAEQAYRTLLITLRRSHKGTVVIDDTVIGPGVVMLELSRIALKKGEEAQAKELIESLIEEIYRDETEAQSLQNNMFEHGEFELICRILETRISKEMKPKKKSELLSQLADILENQLHQLEKAFQTAVESLELDPINPARYDSAKNLALKLGKIDEYLSKIESLLEKFRRDTDALIRCTILLQIGDIYEKEKGDLQKALEIYSQAENFRVRLVDVWRAMARVSGALGDKTKQMHFLELLASMGEDQEETRASALYSMAEILLADSETINEGIETLKKAMDENPRYEWANSIISRAAKEFVNDDRIFSLYESIARKSGDNKIILNYLETKARRETITLEEIREGAELACKLKEFEKAEEFLMKVIESGAKTEGELGGIGWALLGLASARIDAGDYAGAVKWLIEAADTASLEDMLKIANRIFEDSFSGNVDIALTSRLYEKLYERFPTNRLVWEPLAEICNRTKNIERLNRLVEETLDSLQSTEERNFLRLQKAKALLSIKELEEEGAQVLKNILLEDPEFIEAQKLLMDYYENHGMEEEIIELLKNNLLTAQTKHDLKAIKEISFNLGRRIEKKSREEAASIYRSALEWDARDKNLLLALLECLPPEHDPQEIIEIKEKLLEMQQGEDAVKTALELVDLYTERGDMANIIRALEIGYKKDPHNKTIASKLKNFYEEREDFSGLARILLESAEKEEDKRLKVNSLIEAASIYRDKLKNHSKATEILAIASQLEPENYEIEIELIACMKETGETLPALEKLEQIIQQPQLENKHRFQLLKLKGETLNTLGRLEEAIENIEKAYELDSSIYNQLEEYLSIAASKALSDNNYDEHRKYTLKIAKLQKSAGKTQEAINTINLWLEFHPEDIEALRLALEINLNLQNWEEVAKIAGNLTPLLEGDEQVETAITMTEALRKIGKLKDGIQILENVKEKQPENEKIRAEIRSVYEECGMKKELARILIEEATSASDVTQQCNLLRKAGEMLLDAGEINEAIPIFKDILAIEPDNIQTILSLADAYLKIGKIEGADAILEDAISLCKGKRSSDMASLLQRKAKVAAARGEEDVQLQYLYQAFSIDRNNGYLAAELADLAEKLENWDIATKTLRSIALLEGPCPITRTQSYIRQARICLITGDEQRAIFWVKKAQKEDPESPEVKEMLAVLGED